MNKSLMLAMISGIALANTTRAAVEFQSGENKVSLIELYTSEGCSSCPPAEAWLARRKDSAQLWKTFAPVAFHVDYWNSLGWKDRWSAPEYSERQRAYAELWKSDSIYTPCFVLNGKEWPGGFLGRGEPAPSSENVGVLAVASTDTNHWNASFIPSKQSEERYEIHAALLAGGLNSDVQAGENRGRHLEHEFAALNLVDMPMLSTNATALGRFITDTSRYGANRNLAITVWVTRAGELEPIQATGGWLVNPDANGL